MCELILIRRYERSNNIVKNRLEYDESPILRFFVETRNEVKHLNRNRVSQKRQ